MRVTSAQRGRSLRILLGMLVALVLIAPQRVTLAAGTVTYVESIVDGTLGLDGPVRTVISPDNNFIYVIGATSNAIGVFSRNSTTGALTWVQSLRGAERPGGTIPAFRGPAGLAISPDGTSIYATAEFDDALVVFSRNSTTGLLTYVESEVDAVGGVTLLDGPRQVAVSPDGAHVYVATGSDDSIVTFSRNSTTGALTVSQEIGGPGASVPLDAANGVAISPDGASVYVSTSFGYLNVYSRNSTTGALTTVQNLNDFEYQNCDFVIVSPDGRNVYLPMPNFDKFRVFTRNTSTGALTTLQTFVDDESITPGPDDGFDWATGVVFSEGTNPSHVYITANVEDSISIYDRNTTTGALTVRTIIRDNNAGGTADGLDGAYAAVLADPPATTSDAIHLYVVGNTEDSISLFTRNASTGGLTYSSTIRDGEIGLDGLDGVEDLATSSDGAFVYAASATDHAVGVFSRAAGGQLTFVERLKDTTVGGTVATLQGARSVALSPDDNYVYVASNIDDSITVFSRNSTTGRLTFVEAFRDTTQSGTITDLDGAWGVVVSPDGSHLYATANLSDAVHVFSRNTSTGQLTFVETERDGVGGVATLDAARIVTLSPDGAHVYVASSTDDSITVFSRNASNGQLTLVEGLQDVTRPGGTITGIDGAWGVVVSPNGAQVYVSANSSDGVVAFARNTTTGQLSSPTRYFDGNGGLSRLDGTRDIAISANGETVGVGAAIDDAVTIFNRNTTTGALTLNTEYVDTNQVGGTVNGLDGANGVVISPDSDTLYVASQTDDSIVVVDLGGVVVNDPSVTNATTNEDTQTTSGLVITRNVADGTDVSHVQITAITNGTLYQNDGTTQITNGTFITFAQGNAGLRFTPTAGFSGSGSFQIQASVGSTAGGLGGSLVTATITVNPVADTPSVTNASTTEDTQTTSGLVISRNAADGAEVTHFQITGITNGALYQNDGTTAIANGAFITFAQGNAGLRFTPSLNSTASGSFQVQASTSNAVGGLGGGLATATITVSPGADTPSVTNASTTEDTQTTSGLVISRNVLDGAEVTHFQITGITNGTLYQNNGTTAIANGAFITFAQGNAGLRFTPSLNSTASGSFQVQASTSNAVGGLGGGTATATITVSPQNDGPTLSTVSALTGATEDTPFTITYAALAAAANEADVDGDTLSFRVESVSSGTLTKGGLPATTGTLLGVGESLVWTAAADLNGSGINAFTVTVTDGALSSSPAVQVTINVAPGNDAPVLVSAAVQDLAGILEDPSANLGTLVSTILGSAVSDIDASAVEGIAVTGATSSDGTWEYTINGGGAWLPFSGPTAATARLLAADAQTRVRFVPNPDYNGTPASLIFRAWDQSAGAIGGTGDASAGGGTSAFSSATASTSIVVTAVNDAPTLTALGGPLTIDEDASLQSVPLSGIGTGPADEAGQQLTVTASSDNTALIPDPVITYTGGATGSMSFTPVAGANGSAIVTVTITDDGGVANGGADTTTRTLTIIVASINDAPTLAAISDPAAINEDSGLQTVSLSGIGSGAANESQTLAVTATSSNPGLIPDPTVSYSSPAAVGSLSYTPQPNQYGSALITVTVTDSGSGIAPSVNQVQRTFTITVLPLADTPSVTNATTSEDTQTTSGLVITASAADGAEVTHVQITSIAGGTLYQNDGTTAIGEGDFITIAQGGAGLRFTPGADSVAAGGFSVQASTSASAGGLSGGIVAAVITVTPVNDPPTLDAIADQSLLENTPSAQVSLAGISAGPADESGQNLTVTAVSSDPVAIPDPVVTYGGGATGSLTLAPQAGFSGSVSITVTVTDDGGVALGGVDSVSRTFLVQIGPINRRPTLDPISDLTVLEDAAEQTVALTGIGPGAAFESAQIVTITAASDNPTLIPSVAVDYRSGTTGAVRFTPSAHANGTATITVRIADDGGTANGGVDFLEQTFVVNVTAVNDAPSFTGGANQTLASDAGAQTIASWAQGFVPGPANESAQQVLSYQVVSNSNPALFSSVPAIDSAGTLRYTPLTSASGVAVIGVRVQDTGGTANGGSDTSATVTFQITVTAGRYMFYFPLAVTAAFPDLIVDQVTVQNNQLEVTIRNIGSAPVLNPFWVDVYIAPDSPPTGVNQIWQALGQQGLVWGVTTPIPAGGSLKLTIGDRYFQPGNSAVDASIPAGTEVYAQVDSANAATTYGAILELHESRGGAYNNIIGITLDNGFEISRLRLTQRGTPVGGVEVLPPRRLGPQ